MTLSANKLNQHSPYHLTQINDMAFRFVTDQQVHYDVGFYKDTYFMDEGAYHFFIDNPQNEHGFYDPKILDVVTLILEEFFSQEDDDKIVDKTKDYLRYTYNLENASDELQTKQSRKNQITTLLNNIVYNIPKDVQLTEIKNVEKASNGKIVEHIIIIKKQISISIHY